MTIACTSASADRFRCPTKWELWRQVMALLPRGRAWQTHESGGPERLATGFSSEVGEFEVGSTPLGAEPTVDRLTVLEQYWAAYAEVLDYFHQRACALIEEFFCATTVEQREEWAIDYGFPDPCEPWDTLCDKVAAIGGSTCAYLQDIAARRGWAITCQECPAAGADCLVADCDSLCECVNNSIVVEIDLDASPAYSGAWIPPMADAMQSDCHNPCDAPPAPDQIKCLIERFKPAHVRAHYIAV